jgi:hypothetical protein
MFSDFLGGGADTLKLKGMLGELQKVDQTASGGLT